MMESCRHVFQISGIKNREKKRILLKGINQLGGKYIGGSVYRHSSTHLIIPQVLPGEKFLAACAAGKWVVTPKFVLDSVKNGSWLEERSYEVAIFTRSSAAFYPVREWREKVSNGRITGAFQGWRVLLMVQEPTRRDMFRRLLKAGRAEVYNSPPPTFTSITHVMAKPVTESSKSQDAPCYPVSHIVQHLFGSNCVDIKFNITDDHLAEKDNYLDHDFSNLEAEFKSIVIKKEGQPRLCFLQFLGYHDPHHPHSQAILADFSNVGTMIECGLFIEALDSIRSSAFPGLLPPATNLISLLQYAQQGNATSVFLRNFHQVLENLLLTNPPWLAPTSVKKYYAQVLQCPQCKTGLWPFLETAIRYCLSSDITCHPLPGPALPTLVDFHYDIISFCLKLFQGELHSVTSGDFVRNQVTQAPSTFSSGPLVCGTFWTVWERPTLLSRSVKQLTQLIVQAADMGGAERAEMQKQHLADTMLHLLSVLVEFWYQQHFRLNQRMVEKGLKDLSEHLAVVSQDLSPAVLVELVASIRSSRLKLVVADAIFRNLCCRNGFTVGDEPLSLKKMVMRDCDVLVYILDVRITFLKVCSYLPALGALAQSPSSAHHKTGPTSHSCTSPGTSRTQNLLGNITSQESQNTLRGLSKVNTAGETLLHRACIRNQVEAVLQILAHPDTDVNVKDHAGWTPLHEACNHGSTECVKALLRHRPAPVLTDQVGGVSPLHDALLNGHMDIAKMLLEHAGSVLLRQTDEKGRTPMDLVSAPGQKEELLCSAEVGDSTQRHEGVEVLNLPLLEAGSSLLCHLVVSYQLERGLPGHSQPRDESNSLVYKLVRALETHPLQKVTLDWTDQRAVKLVEDVETLLELSQGKHREQVSRAVRECKGESTTVLMEILENLRSRGEILVADL